MAFKLFLDRSRTILYLSGTLKYCQAKVCIAKRYRHYYICFWYLDRTDWGWRRSYRSTICIVSEKVATATKLTRQNMKAIESTIAWNMGGFWLSILCCKAKGPKTERSENLVPYHLSDERLVAPAPNRMVAKSSRRLSAFVNEEREHTARMVQTRLIVMFSLCLLRTLCFCMVLPQSTIEHTHLYAVKIQCP